MESLTQQLHQAAAVLKANPADLLERVTATQEQLRSLEKELSQLKAKLAAATSADLSAEALEVAGIKVLIKSLEGVEAKDLRGMIDQLKDKLKSAVIVLAAPSADKVSVAAGVTADLTERIKAGELVSLVCSNIGGKGGGRPDMAMGGGSDVAALPAAMDAVMPWLQDKLS
ncbi:Alanine--tRNA ligase [Oligella urethralis]|uniref:Alanine--tRNA ligase n=1 Tax=Oligella urethralis TaxID=90245 RepID=A0A2X1WL36_9BURK|nr:Alanine--tRNA ligase [Oligella urethralis]